MPSPMRIPAGFTQNLPFQPLAKVGIPDPLWDAYYVDDFMGYVAGFYTVTATGNGTIAATSANGTGGRVLFTTNSSTPAGTDIVSMQVDSAGHSFAAGQHTAFVTRLQLADVTNPAFLAGIIQTTTTPFTVTNGVYFTKASGATAITLNVVSASVNVGSVTIPLSALTLANATDFDLGFYYSEKGEVEVFAGNGLVGHKPNQNTATLGPIARVTPTAVPTGQCTPTLALQSGTATSKTMVADFLYGCISR